MNIHHRIFVIALCSSFFYGVRGQATCTLAWDNGTALSDTDWSFGFALDTIEDVTAAGTVVLNLVATNINQIRSYSTSDSNSEYIFMEPTLLDGRFVLTLTDYFSQYEELETSATIRMTVIFGCTTNNRTLELALPITDTNNNYPEFQNAPYTYKLPIPLPSGFAVQLFGAISARDIDLTNTLISFTLNSTDSNASGFSASWLSQDTTDTKLHYAQLLTTSLLSIDNDITFQIFATDNGVPALTSETTITVTVDEENSTPTSPVFVNPVYIADYSGLTIEEASGTILTFNQGNVGLSQGIDETVEYTIADTIGGHKDNFGITISNDYSYITITLQDVTEEFLAEKYVILTLTATRSGATNTGVTILHIDLPGINSCTSTTESVSPTSEQTTEYSTITAASTVTEWSTDCPTVTTEQCYCDCSTTITSSGEDKSTTSTPSGNDNTTSSDNDNSISTTEGTTSAGEPGSTTSTGTGTDYTTTDGANTNTATEDDGTATSTGTTECPVVTVTQECYCTTTDSYDASSTTSSSTDSSTTVQTTTTVTSTLSFPSSIYRFDKDSTFTGVLMAQTAVATNAEGTIVYTTTFDDDDLASRIIINADTAELQVTSTISPGIYTFQIIATIEDLNLSASATVILVISTLTDCSGEIVFGYALQIIELEEESAHENILPLDDSGCNYTIYSQTPSQELFSISGNYLNSVAIDREASYFSGMSVAQVRVVIDAICPNGTETDTITARPKRDTEYGVITENIAYERTRTVLVVIITDINDNGPVWSSDTPSYIGFPGFNLSQLIHVPYVYRFSATDADMGDNAIVTYTLPSGSDDVFHVHSSEGSLYIQQGVYAEDNSQFSLIATDGLFKTVAELTVRTLNTSNVVVLFVTGGVLEDVDNIVQELSTSTGYWLSSLGAAVISESDVSSTRSLRSVSRRAKRAADANTLLRLVLYGLENNVPVASEILVTELNAVDFTWELSQSATLESILADNTGSADAITETDTSGYWTAIIVLLVLLFLIIIGTGIMYYLFCRPKEATSVKSDVTYETFENRNSNGSTGKRFEKSVTLGESQDDATESTDSPNADWNPNQTKTPEISFIDKNRRFSSLKGGNDGDLIFFTKNHNETEISPSPSKRKSVAFNTNVEEIEVATL